MLFLYKERRSMSPNYIFSQCKQAISSNTSIVTGPRSLPSFHVYPPSLRATMTIYIVTGGAVLYSPFTSPRQISDERNFTGEYPHAKYPRAKRGETAFSRVYPVVTTLGIALQSARLSSKNLHVRDRPILASG